MDVIVYMIVEILLGHPITVDVWYYCPSI